MHRRLTLVIHSLNGGGAERTSAAMANQWAGEGDEVTFVTLADSDDDMYELSATVNRVCLGGMQESSNVLQAVINNFRRLYRLWRAIAEAHGDVVISFTDKMSVLTLLAAPAGSVIACERTDPRRHPIGRGWSYLRRRTYRRAKAIVAQTPAVADHLRQIAPRVPVYVIPNAVAPNPHQVPRGTTVVGLGRLSPEKGFDLLLDAFAVVAPRHPDWELVIYGEGPARADLQRQIERLGLRDRVRLPGWTDNPQQALASARLFVLPSRYEGFPNGLLEAMAAGLAVAAFDCDSGPREIVRPDVDGLLVPPGDVPALSQALSRLMADESLREELAQRAREVTARFGVVEYFRRWEEVLPADAATEQPEGTA